MKAYKDYTIELRGKNIGWLDVYTIRAKSEADAIDQVMKQWNAEHSPVLKSIFTKKVRCASHKCKQIATKYYNGDYWCTKDYKTVKQLDKNRRDV